MQLDSRSNLTEFMTLGLHTDNLGKAMIPSFSVGCRRLTPGPAYLEVVSPYEESVPFLTYDRLLEKLTCVLPVSK